MVQTCISSNYGYTEISISVHTELSATMPPLARRRFRTELLIY